MKMEGPRQVDIMAVVPVMNMVQVVVAEQISGLVAQPWQTG